MKLLLILLSYVIFNSLIPLSYQQDETATDPWVLDYEFLKEVILIGIPTVTGFFTSKYLTNRWQQNKEKASIKKEILQEFDDSVLHYVMIMLNFNRKLFSEYFQITKNSELDGDKIDHLKNAFPTKIEEYPKNKYKNKIETILDNLGLMDEKAEKLSSSLNLYFDDEGLQKELNELLLGLNPMRLQFNKILISENAEEYEVNNKEFMSIVKPFKIKAREFKRKLAKSKIKMEPKK